MRIHDDIEQGSAEWHSLRAGVITASAMGKILTPKTLKLSSQSGDYLHQIVAERLLGVPCETWEGSPWAERGSELEAESRSWFALEHGVSVREVGFITNDDGTVGCSPDGILDGVEEGLELKNPSAKVHVRYLLDNDALLDAYRHQVQSSLFVTGWRVWWLVSYNPALPCVVLRCEPDAAYQVALREAVAAFLCRVDAAVERIRGFASEYDAVLRNPISGEPM